MTTRHWKPTAADLRAIRAYAAASEGYRPQAVHIEIGERASTDPSRHWDTSTNLLLVNSGDPDDFLEGTDLDQFRSWADFKAFGIPLTEDGRAIVDFSVYEKEFGGDHGDLITNVQAHVATRNSKPVIVGFSATGHDYKSA